MHGKHSEETKRKISESCKGRKAWNKGKKGVQVAWNKGLTNIYSEETLQKIRINTKKAMNDSKIKEKISKALKGIKRSAEFKKKISKATTGKNNPMFGKHLSKEHKRKISEVHKGKNFSEEHKRKISEVRKGRKPTLGKHWKLSEETKQKHREISLFYVQNYPGPYKNTKPELKMKEILNDLNIPFEHQFRLGNHLYDFHIPNTNILIEVDGDYWHGNPKKFKKLSKRQKESKQRDKKVNKLAKENNFVLLRFWENDILNNTEKVKSKLLYRL